MASITAGEAFSRTPPGKEPQLPPSPPASGERPLRPLSIEETTHRRAIFPGSPTADQFSTVEIDLLYNLYESLDDSEERPLWTSRSGDSVVFIMPSGVHEAVRVGAERILDAQLQDWQFQPLGSASIKLEGCNASAQQPDAQFTHEEQIVPALVMEVAHSQPTKDAVKHVKNYIYGTYGQIRLAILISVKSPPEESIMSLWKANFFSSADDVCLKVEEVFCKVNLEGT